jgi:hypothetical protein
MLTTQEQSSNVIASQERTLIVADADRIQAYLFESVNLREIVGASLLVSRFNKEAEVGLGKHGAEIIYSAGGTVRAIVSKEKAQAALNFLRKLYQELTTTGSISLGSADMRDSNDFLRAAKAAEEDLHQNKEAAKNRGGMLLASAFLEHCSACGLRPAVDVGSQKLDGETRREALCETCQAKRKQRGGGDKPALFYDEINEKLRETYGIKVKLRAPQDLNEIGRQSSPSGYVGFIVADGNRMSDKLKECQDIGSYQKQL